MESCIPQKKLLMPSKMKNYEGSQMDESRQTKFKEYPLLRKQNDIEIELVKKIEQKVVTLLDSIPVQDPAWEGTYRLLIDMYNVYYLFSSDKRSCLIEVVWHQRQNKKQYTPQPQLYTKRLFMMLVSNRFHQMNVYEIIWPEPIMIKLFTYQSEFFIPEESYDYIVQLILETENALLNPLLGKPYVEE